MLASIVPPGHRAGKTAEVPSLHNGQLRRKCGELALAILHAAALFKDLGLWTATDGLLCSAQPVTQQSACLPPRMFGSAVSPRQQQAVPPVSDDLSVQLRPLSNYLSGGTSSKSPSITLPVQSLQEDAIEPSVMHYECMLHCTARAVLQPHKALQGMSHHLYQLFIVH